MKRACWLILLAAACSRAEPAIELEPVPSVDLEALDPRAANRIREGGEPGALGMVYHAYDLVPQALACYRNATRLDPGAGRWPYYTALIQLDSGDLDGARALFRQASEHMESAEQRIALHCKLGGLELDAGRIDAARVQFEQAIALRERCGPAYIGLGRCAIAEDRPGVALDPLRRAVTLLPHASNAHYLLGTAYRQTGAQRMAEQHLRRSESSMSATVSVADPLLDEVRVLADSAYRHRYLGARYFQLGRFVQAEGEFRKALAAKPDDTVSRVNLGAALVRLGRAEQATVEFRAVIEQDAAAVLARVNLATLRAQAGDDEGAISLYQRALELDSTNKTARFNLANGLSRLGRYESARVEYAKVVAADPANGAARLGEARMRILLVRHAEAVARLEEAIAALPGDERLQHELARLLIASEDEAVRDAKRGLALANVVLARRRELLHAQTVAMGHAALAEFEKATRLLEEGLTVAGNARRKDLVARLNRDLALYRAGKPRRVVWYPDEIR